MSAAATRGHVDTGGRSALGWALAFAGLWTLVEVIAAPLLASMPIAQLVWLRYAVHLVVVLLVWGRARPFALLGTGRPALQAFRSALMLVMPMSWALSVWSGQAPSSVMAVFWSAAVMIPGFAVLLGHERPGARAWAAAVLAWGAAALACGTVRPPELSGWPLPLAMAASFALYVVLTRSLRHEPIGTNLFWTGAGVFVLLTPAMPAVWQPVPVDLAARVVAVGTLGVGALYALDRMAAAAPVGATAPALAAQAAILPAIAVAMSHSSTAETLGATLLLVLCAGCWWAAGVAGQGRPDARRNASNRGHGAIR